MSARSRWAVVAVAALAFVLVPFALVGEPLEAWMTALVDGLHHPAALSAAVAGLLLVDVFLPVPSSVVATAAGAALGWVPGALAVWVGLTAGHALGYAAGRSGGAPGLSRFLGEDEVARARAWLDRHGRLGLALTRPVPVLSEATVLLAGALRASPARTVGTCALANIGVAVVYAGAGALSAQSGLFGLAVAAALGLPALAMAAAGLLSRSHPARSPR